MIERFINPCSLPRLVSTFRAVAAVILLEAGTSAYGHGRMASTVEADLQADKARVVIRISVEELLELDGIPKSEFAKMGATERQSLVASWPSALERGFRIYGESNEALTPVPIKVEFPQYEAGEPVYEGIDQQMVAVELEYRFDSPPNELTFWHCYDAVETEHGLYSSFRIRRQGNLVMLPTDLGPAMPVRYPMDWDREPVSVAGLDDLGAVTCGPANRPASAELKIGTTAVSWRIYLPVRTLAEVLTALGIPWDARMSGKEVPPALRRLTDLVIDGVPAPDAQWELHVYPYTAMSLMHGRILAGEAAETGLAALTLTVPVDGLPKTVQVSSALPGDQVPRMHTAVYQSGRLVDLTLLSSDSNHYQWGQ